eukprot:7958658-Pyramimonas_sp.AAC.1
MQHTLRLVSPPTNQLEGVVLRHTWLALLGWKLELTERRDGCGACRGAQQDVDCFPNQSGPPDEDASPLSRYTTEEHGRFRT